VGEGSFDAVALFVEGFVEAALHDTAAAWWDDDFGSAPAQVLEDGFGGELPMAYMDFMASEA
jgi:hypothetical protein